MTVVSQHLDLGTDGIIALDAQADLTAIEPLAGPALVIAGASASTAELRYAPADAVIARSVADFRATKFVEIHHYVVSADGFLLAGELLAAGDLDPARQILWSLDLPLLETLARLNTIGLAEDVTVCRVSGDLEQSVITTAAGSGGKLEADSFRAGLQVGATLGGNGQGSNPEDSTSSQALALLRRKHLSVLESLSPVDAEKQAEAVQPEGSTADSARLENDLILLKRRYDALDRKYTALANSRLGALTLRLWAKKNPSLNKAISTKDGEK